MKQERGDRSGTRKKVCTLGKSNESGKTVIYQRYGNKIHRDQTLAGQGGGRVSLENLDDDGSKINQRKEHKHKSRFGAE